jgi:hypothetical protein
MRSGIQDQEGKDLLLFTDASSQQRRQYCMVQYSVLPCIMLISLMEKLGCVAGADSLPHLYAYHGMATLSSPTGRAVDELMQVFAVKLK